MKSITLALVTIVTLASPALAQDPPQPAQAAQAAQTRSPQPAQPPQERQRADERERTMPPPPPPAPPAPVERRPHPAQNVRIEVTITDQTGTAAPTKKVVAMVMADGRASAVRSTTGVPIVTTSDTQNLLLNVDANASVTTDRKVLVDLRFNYSSMAFVAPIGVKERPTPVSEVEKQLSSPRSSLSIITENISVLLSDGTPTVVARSNDAATDRTVTVEVKAEILK